MLSVEKSYYPGLKGFSAKDMLDGIFFSSFVFSSSASETDIISIQAVLGTMNVNACQSCNWSWVSLCLSAFTNVHYLLFVDITTSI